MQRSRMKESLDMYRQERRSFISGLRQYFGVDFYKLDRIERTEWLRTYIESKREFLTNLIEFWEDTHVELNSFDREKKSCRKNRKLLRLEKRNK
jgi:hypothetical protein